MAFTEPRFLFFFLPILLLIYYLSPRRYKNGILLGASIYCYAAGEGFNTAVILVSMCLNFFLGHFVDKQQDPKQRFSAVTFAVGINLALLFAFKYIPFVVDNLNFAFHLAGLHELRRPKIHLPLGISFFTFHAISYLVNISRREVKPMEKFHNFALYITLFPQLVAGPIIRFKTIRDQFALDGPSSRRHSVEAFAYGIRRFIIGLAKKILIANTVAVAADGVFNSSRDSFVHAPITPAAAWLGVLCYTLQIYYDFSGYSDMAIGLGHMFGFKFPENFNYPYISQSVTEFWRRWHMSLSSWFRDYLYIPLGGNRVSPQRTYLNLLIVFFLCGFWHGSAWNFITWGLYFGFFLILERFGFGKFLEKIPSPFRHLYLLLIVMIGWVFFRSDTLPDARSFLMRMLGAGVHYDRPYMPADVFLSPTLWIAIIAGILGSIPWLPALQTAWNKWTLVRPGHSATVPTLAARLFELVALTLLFLPSAALSANGTYSPFIYFHF